MNDVTHPCYGTDFEDNTYTKPIITYRQKKNESKIKKILPD